MGMICCTELKDKYDDIDPPNIMRRNGEEFDEFRSQRNTLSEKYDAGISDVLFNSGISKQCIASVIKNSKNKNDIVVKEHDQETAVGDKTDTVFYSFADDSHYKQIHNKNNNSNSKFGNFYFHHENNIKIPENENNNNNNEVEIENENNLTKHSIDCAEEFLEESSKINEFQQYLNEDVTKEGWEKGYQNDSEKTILHKKMIPGCPSIYVRAETVIKNTTPEQVLEQIYNIELRKKWDKMMKELKIVEKIDEKRDCFYFKLDAGFAVSNRDWVIKRLVIKQQQQQEEQNENNGEQNNIEEQKEQQNKQNKIQLISYSMEHDSAPECKGIIRADCPMQSYQMVQEGDDVKLFIISSVDIKGSVPAFIVNKFSDSGTRDWINGLRNAIKNNQKK